MLMVPLDEKTKADLGNHLSSFDTTDQVVEFLTDLSKSAYDGIEKQLGLEITRQHEANVYLGTIDVLWMTHLDTMDDLRAGIGLRGYAQRDPLIEYKREAFDLFEKLIAEIDYEIVHRIYKIPVGAIPPTSAPQGIEIRPQVDISIE